MAWISHTKRRCMGIVWLESIKIYKSAARIYSELKWITLIHCYVYLHICILFDRLRKANESSVKTFICWSTRKIVNQLGNKFWLVSYSVYYSFKLQCFSLFLYFIISKDDVVKRNVSDVKKITEFQRVFMFLPLDVLKQYTNYCSLADAHFARQRSKPSSADTESFYHDLYMQLDIVNWIEIGLNNLRFYLDNEM